jgi:hypothetical protein
MKPKVEPVNLTSIMKMFLSKLTLYQLKLSRRRSDLWDREAIVVTHFHSISIFPPGQYIVAWMDKALLGNDSVNTL